MQNAGKLNGMATPQGGHKEEGVRRVSLSKQIKHDETMQQFHFYSLPKVLPEGHVLVLNIHPYTMSTFVLTQLSAEAHGLVAQEVLTELEMYALVALLEAYPHYCPYEVLRAAITDEVVSNARITVHRAVEHKTMNRSMKPVRNILSRCRAKLKIFGIDIRSIHAEGYILTAL